jgi:hypothetical protein
MPQPQDNFKLADELDARVISYFLKHQSFNDSDPEHLKLNHSPGIPTFRGAFEQVLRFNLKRVGSTQKQNRGIWHVVVNYKSQQQQITLDLDDFKITVKLQATSRSGAGSHQQKDIAAGYALRNAVRQLLQGVTIESKTKQKEEC